jgi:hypothetical protein
VGYIGRNAESHYYDVDRRFLETVELPVEQSESTVAVEIRGRSFGRMFDHWLIFYDDIRAPVNQELIGKLCIVGLNTGRVVFKSLQQSKLEGRFDLFSENAPPEQAVQVKWAAKIKKIVQPTPSLKAALKRRSRAAHRRDLRR